MKRVAIVSMVAAACIPDSSWLRTPQPKYPPGFDCATLPSDDEREACTKWQLSPTMDGNQDEEPAARHRRRTRGSGQAA